ncbi:MAG: PP2C family protein-serine/threonine phosphatase, partial [Bdellovibrionota bacterium]
ADREQLKWGTAASPPLYIVGSDGAAEVLSKQGAPLGQLGTKFTIGSRKLKGGDRIFAFTDGVYEFETKGAGRAFGLKRLLQLFSEQKAKSAGDARNQIIQELDSFRGAVPLRDDMSLLVIDRG